MLRNGMFLGVASFVQILLFRQGLFFRSSVMEGGRRGGSAMYLQGLAEAWSPTLV